MTDFSDIARTARQAAPRAHLNRRDVIVAAAAGLTILPFTARAEAHGPDSFATDGGQIVVHPVHHASMVLETPGGVIHVDPVGGADLYAGLPAPDLILITHEHGDHFDPATLAALAASGARIIANPAVAAQMPGGLVAEALANGQAAEFSGIQIAAIAAQNTTPDRMNFHPTGRDNGYVLTIDGFRIYISGDTEPTPDMLALSDIDLCFLCMNLPFTQTAQQAAEAVLQFRPRVVYPYHYSGRDGGTQDPQVFADLVGAAAEVRQAAWYAPGELG